MGHFASVAHAQDVRSCPNSGLMRCSKTALAIPSVEQLGGARKKYTRNCEAERLRCFEVDKQLYFGDLLNRQISGLLTLEDASGLDASLAVRFHKAASVTHQTARDSKVARLMDSGHQVPGR